jgi:hypothetical protein
MDRRNFLVAATASLLCAPAIVHASSLMLIKVTDWLALSANEIWQRGGGFSVRKEQMLWYYRSLADTFCERLPGQLSNELREIVEALEADVAKSSSSMDVSGPPVASERRSA